MYRFLHICKNSTIQNEKPIRSGKIVGGLFQKPNNVRKAAIKLKSNKEYDYTLRITIKLYLIGPLLSNLPEPKILRIIFSDLIKNGLVLLGRPTIFTNMQKPVR